MHSLLRFVIRHAAFVIGLAATAAPLPVPRVQEFSRTPFEEFPTKRK